MERRSGCPSTRSIVFDGPRWTAGQVDFEFLPGGAVLHGRLDHWRMFLFCSVVTLAVSVAWFIWPGKLAATVLGLTTMFVWFSFVANAYSTAWEA